jgi:hypothetical protein
MPTSRCVITQFLCGCTNSTGSSTVTIWPKEFSLRQSIMAASVVDLPEPVAPTMMVRPRLVMATSFSTCGMPRPSMVGSLAGMVRSTMPTLPCCTNAFTRKRPMPGGGDRKVAFLVRSNSAVWRSFMTERVSASVCCAPSACCDTLVTLPSTLMAGGKSAVMNRSLPLRLTMSLSRSLMNWLA